MEWKRGKGEREKRKDRGKGKDKNIGKSKSKEEEDEQVVWEEGKCVGKVVGGGWRLKEKTKDRKLTFFKYLKNK